MKQYDINQVLAVSHYYLNKSYQEFDYQVAYGYRFNMLFNKTKFNQQHHTKMKSKMVNYMYAITKLN